MRIIPVLVTRQERPCKIRTPLSTMPARPAATWMPPNCKSMRITTQTLSCFSPMIVSRLRCGMGSIHPNKGLVKLGASGI